MKTIWKRELKGYFYTPVGYVFIGVFLAVSSVMFYMAILRQRSGDLPTFIGEMSYLWMLLSPVLTMRLMAEEKQKKTDQLLLTSPVSMPGIVLGKYLAAVTVLLAASGLTLLYVLVVAVYGRVYPAELAVNYLGFILQGCAFAALDMYISGRCSSPVTAAIAAFGANFLLWITDLLAGYVEVGWISEALSFISLYSRHETFLMGQLSFAGVLFDLSFIAVFIVLTRRGMDRGRPVSAVTAWIAVAAIVALNAGALTLEKKNGWRVDLSYNGITTQSAETREIMERLDRPVHIYAMYRKGDEDLQLIELLDRYAASSEYITWEHTDASLNPALVNRFSTDSVAVTSDSLVVYCGETDRWRVLGAEDYISLSMDEETGNYSYAGYTYERSITGAIDYVSRDNVPQVVIVQGHGELDGETVTAFQELLEANQYEVSYTDLKDDLDPSDLLIFFCPMRDVSDEELEKLSGFAGKGGSFLFACDYSDPLDSMPNYSALLRSYGFMPKSGLVVEDRSNTDAYYNGNRIYLIPEVLSTDITIDMIASGAVTLLMPGARAFENAEESDRNLTISDVLRSGEGSYLKKMTTTTASMDKEEGDETGPFTLALQARRVTTEGYVSRAFITGSSGMLTAEQIWAMTDTRQFLTGVMGFLLDTGASGLTMSPKDALRPSLDAGSTMMGSVMVAALPLAALLAALLILLPRRNR